MPTKREIIEALRRSQERVHTTFSSLSPGQIVTRVHDDEGDQWTARDVLAHLAGRQPGYQRLLQAVSAGGAVAPRPPVLDLNERNRLLVGERKGKSVAELLQEFRQIHDELARQVETMQEETLATMVETPRGRVTLGEQLLAASSQHAANHTAIVKKALGLENL